MTQEQAAVKKTRGRKLFCTVVARIIDPATGHEAGLLYRWNTGATQKEWYDKPIRIFRLEPLPEITTLPVAKDD